MPTTDRSRAFWGSPQLTPYENQVLVKIRREPLRVVIEHGRPEYWVGTLKIRKATARHLIDFQHVVPLDAALLPDALAQSYRLA